MKKFKNIYSGMSAAFIAVSAAAAMSCISAGAAQSGFHVSGTEILDANNKPFVMRGVNIAHAWYQNDTNTSVIGAAENGSNTVRVVVADGQKWSKTSKSELENIINICKENDVICILEVHDATGSNNTYDLDNAVNYWIENKSVLQGNEEYVILNIANEWYGEWNGYNWAEGNKSAVKKLRNADIDNMIMVDCAGWGQYPACIKEYGRSVYEADVDRNTVFSIHMYEYAGGNASTIKKNIDDALSIDVPVVIGEFGGQHTGGDVDEATIMSYCTQKNVGYLGWSWKGNNSDLSYLDISYDFAGKSLTPWGDALINGSNGIKATSKKCSVFGGQQQQQPEYNYSQPEISSILYDIKYHQFRINWTPVQGAEQYGIAVKLAGKWKVQEYTNNTTFTSPKLRPGSRYTMVVCAKVNGKWQTADIAHRAFTVTVR